MKELSELNSVKGLMLDTGFISYILGSDAGQELIWHTKLASGSLSSAVFEQAKACLLDIFRPSSLTRREKDEMYNSVLNCL